MNTQRLKDIFGSRYLENVSLKSVTSFKTGGEARVMLLVQNEDEFISGLRFVKENSIPYYILGNCSNVLISDHGLDGVVFMIGSVFSAVSVKEDIIEAQAGILLSALSKTAYANSLTGLEFASGIPGSLGAAVAINASAYDGQIKDVILETRYLDENMNIQIIPNEQHDFGYRHSIFTDSDKFVLSSKLKLSYGDKTIINDRMKELSEERRRKQPLNEPSAGSVFKRPTGYYAGKLIQDAGLKGFRIGNAAVSELHAGFIVNKGGASSLDVYKLIKHIKNEVKKNSGVDLETEVKILGDFREGGSL